jgi:hypothetical protein
MIRLQEKRMHGNSMEKYHFGEREKMQNNNKMVKER